MRLPHQPIARRSKALSTVYGKIEQILLCIDGDQQNVEQLHLGDKYHGLFEAFGDRVSFVVLGHFGHDRDQALRDGLVEKGLDPDLVQIHTPLADRGESLLQRKQSGFIQDPFVIMETEQGDTLLLEPYRQHLEQNAYLAEQFADATGFAILPTRYLLEGGNILVGDDYAFIGRNILERNRRQFFQGMPQEEAEARIAADLKRILSVRYIIWIGSKEPIDHPLVELCGPEAMQPFYHIDLFLTLGGKDHMGNEIVLLAEIETSAMEKEPTKEQEMALAQIGITLKDVKAQLEEYSKGHGGPRFVIEEIPMSGVIRGEGERMRFTPYSYNNAQVEWYHGIRRIYLPSFPRHKDIEQKLRENLPGLGFTKVVFVRYDLEQFALRKGGLHCLTKVLRRGSY